jgi:hypothetical protein
MASRAYSVADKELKKTFDIMEVISDAHLDEILTQTEGKTLRDDYVCPITRCIMRNPVAVATGHIYERIAIESWFEKGNDTNPMTNTPLPHRLLVLMNRLRDEIADFVLAYINSPAGAGMFSHYVIYFDYQEKKNDNIYKHIILNSADLGNINFQADFDDVVRIISKKDLRKFIGFIDGKEIPNGSDFFMPSAPKLVYAQSFNFIRIKDYIDGFEFV